MSTETTSTPAMFRRLSFGGGAALLQRLGSVFGLILLLVALSVMSPDFLTAGNLLTVLRQVSINALIAFGMTFVILAGGIDLSVGAILAFTGAITAGVMAAGHGALLAVGAGLGLGLLASSSPWWPCWSPEMHSRCGHSRDQPHASPVI
ncbi:MAG: hypothetical protein WDW38_009015 [Sanguina aurantia]